MSRQNMLHLAAGILLILLAALLGYDAYQGHLAAQPATTLETWGKVLVALLSGIGGLYALTSKQQHDVSLAQIQAANQTNLELLRGSISQLNTSISSEQALRSTVVADIAKRYIAEQFEPRMKELEAAADSKKKYIELVYEDDFRRRERRDLALVTLSRAVMRTSRAFRTLSKFRLDDGAPSEALVNILAQALGAREAFLSAREELVVLHAVAPEHEQILRAYSGLLIDLIIDVRRPTPRDSITPPEYDAIMRRHEGVLDQLDGKIGELLSVFLAPRQREPSLQ